MKNKVKVGRMKRATKPQWLALAGVCVSLSVAAPAAADASDKAAAEALFQQAKNLMGQKQYQEACEKFRTSQELDAGLGTLLHLGDCYEKLGRTASAWATFEEAASVAAGRGDVGRQQVAQSRAARLKPQLSYVVIRSAQPLPSGAVVSRDGRPVPEALWGSPVPVDPGTLTIRVTAPGYREVSMDVKVPVVASAPIETVLPPMTKVDTTEPLGSEPATAATPNGTSNSAVLDPAQNTAPRAVNDGASSQATWGLVLGGVGVVAVGVATVFTLTGYSSYQESLDDCSSADENSCGVTGNQARQDAISDLNLATIVGAAGAVALGAGVVLYVTAPSAAPTSGVEQALSTRGVGLGYQGVW